MEKGVETGGVAAANWEGVRPCCEGACFMGVGVAILISNEDKVGKDELTGLLDGIRGTAGPIQTGKDESNEDGDG